MKKNYHERIINLLRNKAKLEKVSLFTGLFGWTGWAIAIIGIIISFDKGLDIIDWNSEKGIGIILGGALISWTVGMMVWGFAALIDTALRTAEYTKTLLEYMITQKDSAILSDFENGAHYVTDYSEGSREKWECPYCGAVNASWHTSCQKCDYSLEDQAVEDGEDEFDSDSK